MECAVWASVKQLRGADEVWIHCGWKPCLWWAAAWGKKVKWMPEGCYDPVRLGYHGWKKKLAGPIERWGLRRCRRVVATCEEEGEWIRAYIGKGCPEVEVSDIKRFFDLAGVRKGDSDNVQGRRCEERPSQLTLDAGKISLRIASSGRESPIGEAHIAQQLATLDGLSSPRHDNDTGAIDNDVCKEGVDLRVLYLGRGHELKGVEFLEEAVKGMEGVELRKVSGVEGEEKERVWDWCEVLVLPTLSDNFGLVVAEALERGKRVITTDGAPAWGDGEDYGGRLKYLKGYREGTREERVELLRRAVEEVRK